MSTVRRVAKNAIVLYAAQVISSLLSLLLTIYIARKLGDIALGKYSFAFAFVAYSEVFLELGFNTLLIREAARDKTVLPKVLGNILLIRIILAIAILVITAGVIVLMDYPTDTEIVIVILSMFIVLTSFGSIFRATFRAFERMEFEAFIVALSRIIAVSLAGIAIYLGYGLLEVSIAFLIAGIGDLSLSYITCNAKFAKPKFEIDLGLWKRLFKEAVPIGFMVLATMIFVRTGTIILSVVEGDAVVGWYNAAYNLVLAPKPIPMIFGVVMLPVMARQFLTTKEGLRKTYERIMRYLLLLGLPLAVGITLLADRIILLLYGSQFTPSVIALQILAWDILLVFLYTPINFLLIAINKQNEMALATAGSAIINIILNLLLIPHLSYIGSGFATVASETLLLALFYVIMARNLYRLPVRLAFRPVFASVGMAGFLYLFRDLQLVLLIGLAVIIYAGLLLLSKAFPEDDLSILKEMFRFLFNRTQRKKFRL